MAGGAAHQIIGDQPAFLFSGTFLDPAHLALGGRLQSGVVSLPGGGFDAVTETYRWPQLLPDGKHVLDINFDSRGRHVARVMRPGSPEAVRELMETDSRVEYAPSSTEPGMGYLVYVRAGNVMAQPFDPSALRLLGTPTPIARKVFTFLPSGAAEFSVSQNGTLAYQSLTGRSQLMWIDRSGRRISEVSPPNLLLRGARISPDQRIVATAAYDIEKGSTSIWLFDAAKGAGRIVSGAPGNEDSPVWSPDSRKLVFHRALVSLPSLFMRYLSEEGREDAVSSGGFHVATDWSSDGRYIVFTNTGFGRASYEATGDLFLVDTQTQAAAKILPLLSTPFHESGGSWSPDGTWLACTSNESGRPEIYLQRFEGGATPSLTGPRYPVTLNGAEVVRWRRDGKELFYLSHDGNVYAVRVSWGERPQFGAPVALFRFSVTARAAIHGILGFDVSPDGQKFVVPIVQSEERGHP
jgi:eukaryotic-like serine/threonine-protein kinase